MADPGLVPVEERATVLVVAGLDPTGGAGLAADGAVIRACGAHPLLVATGIAVQNTSRAVKRHDLPAALLAEQLETLTEEFLLGAVKVGMLGRAETVEALSTWLAERPRLPVVLDPVLRSSSGGALADAGLDQVLIRSLVPRCRVLTPNLEEASVLTGRDVVRREDVPEAARVLRDMGADWVLIKGGHLRLNPASDFLLGPDTEFWLDEERIEGNGARGTGCALASALAAGMAKGDDVPTAVRTAKAFVTRGLRGSYVSGRGRFLDFWGTRPAR